MPVRGRVSARSATAAATTTAGNCDCAAFIERNVENRGGPEFDRVSLRSGLRPVGHLHGPREQRVGTEGWLQCRVGIGDLHRHRAVVRIPQLQLRGIHCRQVEAEDQGIHCRRLAEGDIGHQWTAHAQSQLDSHLCLAPIEAGLVNVQRHAVPAIAGPHVGDVIDLGHESVGTDAGL